MALLRPVPGYTGSCAHSPIAVDDDIPVGNDKFDNVVAIGKLIGSDGRIVGWIYRTADHHLRIQRVWPPQDSEVHPAQGSVGHTYSGVDPFENTTYAARVQPCVKSDFRYRTTH